MTDQAQTPTTPSTPAEAITTDAATIPEPVQDNSTSQPTSFLEQLSEERREAPGLKKFEKGGADALAKSYLELEAKLASGDKIALPKGTPEEDPDGWADVFKRIGRPEGADKYSFLNSEEAAADPLINPYAENSHKIGLSDDQAKDQYEWFQRTTNELAEAARVSGEAAMKDEWGTEYASRLLVADEFISEKISPEFSEVLRKTGIAHNPEFVKFAYAAAKNAREDASFQDGENDPTPQTLADNPYAKDTPHFNMTRQGQLERNDPNLAARYRKEAGFSGF